MTREAARLPRLRQIAGDFRRAIEESPPKMLGIGLEGFPRGACDDATLLLGRYLIETGEGEFDYVAGERPHERDSGMRSHAWLQQRDICMDARAAVLYEVFPQLDALGTDGVARLLAAFSTNEAEADEVADKAFEAYGQLAGEGDMGDFADSARDEGIAYYRTLSELKQGVTNLLAIGLYHLFEQHKDRVKSLLPEGRELPDLTRLSNWQKVGELRLVANTVKHGHGASAGKLRAVRPDYFVDPILRESPMRKLIERYPKPVENPLGGTDLFVSKGDLDEYRDALRGLWEELLPYF